MAEQTVVYDALHIGRSKCASTYLQETALAAHPGIELIFSQHKTLFHRYWDYRLGDKPADFVQRLSATAPLAQAGTATTDAPIRVFSHESLTGNMATGVGARLNADLAVRAFGPIKAFMIVREPYAYIYSVWNQYIQEGGVLTLKDYLYSDASPTWNRDEGRSRLWQTAGNSELVRYWRDHLGTDADGQQRLGVFLLEDISPDPAAFWASIYRFLGADDNFVPPPSAERTGLPLPLLHLARIGNRMIRHKHNPGGLLPTSLHPRWRQFCRRLAPHLPSRRKPDIRALAGTEIQQWLREDNRQLAQLLNRDLASLKYDM